MSNLNESDMESKATISTSLEKDNPQDPETAALVPLAPPETQVQAPRRRNRRLKPLPEYIDKYIVSERQRPNGRIDKHFYHKELHLHFRSLVEIERYESRGIYPGCSKKGKENEDQTELHEPLLLLTCGETGESSTMERTNSKNFEKVDSSNSPKTTMHMSNPTASASTAPKVGRHGRKRKMKTVVSLEVEASIGVEQNDQVALTNVPMNDETALRDVRINDEVALIDVPIIDEATLIDVPIIDEATLIDVPITYVENFRDVAR